MQSFSVGNQQVDRSKVNPQLIARMADCAKEIKAAGAPTPDVWQALSERVAKMDAVSAPDLQTIQNMGKAVFGVHKKVHAAFRDSGYKDQSIAAQLADVHIFSSGADAIRTQLSLASARSAVAALAGASFGPTALVTAYAAYSHLPDPELKPLMDELQAIRNGTSQTTFEGNAVAGFHGNEVWPQMMKMADEGLALARAGTPVQMTDQYYELTNQQYVGKLAAAAEAGAPLRINVDGGRLVAFRGTHVEADDVPNKMRSLLQLMAVTGNVGVTVYPVSKLLGDPEDLMHRKGFSVGEKFFLKGMNGNEGSGENFDAGYVIQGPAARQLVANFARDAQASAGASNEDIFGKEPLANFLKGDINVGSRGLIALIDSMHGPAPAGTPLAHASNRAEMEAVLAKYGEKLSDYIAMPPEKIDEMMASGAQMTLSDKGKQAMLALIERTLELTRTPENIARVKDIKLPEGKPAGTTTVSIADLPVHREALMLTAIQEAEAFMYIPAFVMTRSVAAMIVARRDELRAQGKEIDIRVIADSGIYPDGGTPNEEGMKFLEDNGIPCRWTMLVRGSEHDRKIHAKDIITDKGEFEGSTNFSIKGLRENWEQSGYIRWNKDDPQSLAQRDRSKAQFLDLWEHESIEINSLARGMQMRWRQRNNKDYTQVVEEARFNVQRDSIHGIEKAEVENGAWVMAQAADPQIAASVKKLTDAGYDIASARTRAVRDKMGDEAFFAAINGLPERAKLEDLKPRD